MKDLQFVDGVMLFKGHVLSDSQALIALNMLVKVFENKRDNQLLEVIIKEKTV